MSLDPQRVSDTRGWLTKALHDLQAAETLLTAERPLTDVATFHCQQAAEKALKAFLFWHDVAFRKTHELEELGSACVEIDDSLGYTAETAAVLTPFAWRFRSPGESFEPSMEDARGALTEARSVYDAIVARLPADVRP
jgi:HEPN domain-containing protein